MQKARKVSQKVGIQSRQLNSELNNQNLGQSMSVPELKVHKNKKNDQEKNELTSLDKKLADIVDMRQLIQQNIIQTFSQLRKRMIKTIEKSQKKILKQFLQQTSANSSMLYKNQTEKEGYWSQLSQGSYMRKAESFYASLKSVNLQQSFKNLQKSIKIFNDDLKDLQTSLFKDLVKITNEQSLDFKKTIQMDQIIDRICLVNNKVIKANEFLTQISCQHNKASINRAINFFTSIKMPQKSKQYLIVFSESRMQIFNDKLVLIGKKDFGDFIHSKILQVTQVQSTNYLYITQPNRVIRLDLMNLNRFDSNLFCQPFSMASETDLSGSLACLIGQNKIMFISEDIEKLYEVVSPVSLKRIKCDQQNTYGLGQGRICIWNNFELTINCPIQNPLDLIRVNNGKAKFVISANSKCLELIMESEHRSLNQSTQSNPSIQGDQQGQQFHWKNYSKQHRSKIKQVVSNGTNMIYCLAENGRKVYIYELM